MLLMFLYLLGAYVLCAAVFVVGAVSLKWLRRAGDEERGRRGGSTLLVGLALLALPLPWVPYALVELRTRSTLSTLGPAIAQAVNDVNGDRRIRHVKVLSASNSRACAYVVTPCGITDPTKTDGWVAILVTLARRGGEWRFEGDYDVVWSDCGSAQGNVFPPYPSKGDLR